VFIIPENSEKVKSCLLLRVGVWYCGEGILVPDSFALSLQKAQALAAAEELRQCNALSERYGLSLNEAQIIALASAQTDALRQTGRIALGGGVLPKLIYAFCDSPFIERQDYCDTLITLQDLFYTFKNELGNALTDDELIAAMEHLFNGRGQGSLSYLENATNGDLFRAANPSTEEEPDDEF